MNNLISKKIISVIFVFCMHAGSTYALAAPQQLIPLNSPKGAELLDQSLKPRYFWNLMLQFVTQKNLASCGIASSIMVLNAMHVEAPPDPDYGPYRVFTQNNFFTPDVEKVLPASLVNKQGATLDQIGKALTTFGVKVDVLHANSLTKDDFRTLAIQTMEKAQGYIIVNILRTSIGQSGAGHMSPLAAYDKKTDRFLMLDVARYRYPPVWVKTEDLWNAMNTLDNDAHAYRGFLIVYDFSTVLSKHAMVVTNNYWATEAADEILSLGGNAFDAAIAAGLVLGLTEPQSSGLGGGGYALGYSAIDKKKLAYDGREVAPHSASPTDFLDKNGQPMDLFQAILSPKSIGVPSEVALFYTIHKKQGRLAWDKLFIPAMRLAHNGFPLSPLLHAFLSENEIYFKNNEPVQKLYFDEGKIKLVGSIIYNEEYAKTLAVIAQHPEDFYQGRLAKEIIADINEEAGRALFNAEDFSKYKVKIYPALCSDFRSKYTICSIPPSSSGGTTLQELLGIYALKYLGNRYEDPMWMYYFFEACKLAYADRDKYLSDPDFVKQPIAGLLAPKYLLQRSQLIGPKALVPPVPAGVPEGADAQYVSDSAYKIPGTSSLVVVDKDDNAISLTVTIEAPFGSHRMTHGFFLNNELTDFSFSPKNKEGKPIANRMEAGKRPRSSIAPVLVFDKNKSLYALLGSPGGSTIICYVAKSLIQLLDMHRSPQDAISSPNLCAPNSAAIIEETPYPVAQIEMLQKMGEDVVRKKMQSGLAVIIRVPNGWAAAADARREGLALGH